MTITRKWDKKVQVYQKILEQMECELWRPFVVVRIVEEEVYWHHLPQRKRRTDCVALAGSGCQHEFPSRLRWGRDSLAFGASLRGEWLYGAITEECKPCRRKDTRVHSENDLWSLEGHIHLWCGWEPGYAFSYIYHEAGWGIFKGRNGKGHMKGKEKLQHEKGIWSEQEILIKKKISIPFLPPPAQLK